MNLIVISKVYKEKLSARKFISQSYILFMKKLRISSKKKNVLN